MMSAGQAGPSPAFTSTARRSSSTTTSKCGPTARAELRSLVQSGTIRIGPWYLLTDIFLVSGEALIPCNSKSWHTDCARFGRPARRPDIPGSVPVTSAQLPQILAGFGLKFTGARLPRRWTAAESQSVHLGGARRQFGAHGFLPVQAYSDRPNLPTESADGLSRGPSEIAGRERDFAAGTPKCGDERYRPRGT